MNYILALSLLVGSPPDIPKKDIFILIDSKDKRIQNFDVVRRSKIVLAELSRDWLPEEKFYINYHYNIIIEELEDKNPNKKYPCPSFKFSKNQDYQEFCPGTFSSSGTFIISLYSILRWEKYVEDIVNWRRNYSIRFSVNGNTYWRFQPPEHPIIFPATETKATAYYFYKYREKFNTNSFIKTRGKIIELFSTFSKEDWDFGAELVEPEIETTSGLMLVFYQEYSPDNFMRKQHVIVDNSIQDIASYRE